jgi:hypothetical protein
MVTLLALRLRQLDQVKQSGTLQGFQNVVIVVETKHGS